MNQKVWYTSADFSCACDKRGGWFDVLLANWKAYAYAEESSTLCKESLPLKPCICFCRLLPSFLTDCLTYDRCCCCCCCSADFLDAPGRKSYWRCWSELSAEQLSIVIGHLLSLRRSSLSHPRRRRHRTGDKIAAGEGGTLKRINKQLPISSVTKTRDCTAFSLFY